MPFGILVFFNAFFRVFYLNIVFDQVFFKQNQKQKYLAKLNSDVYVLAEIVRVQIPEH